jgi:hypothetical protein
MNQMMHEALILGAAAYMLAGMFFLVASGILERLTGGWNDLLDQEEWLPVTRTVLYLLAVGQILVLWALWPFGMALHFSRSKTP